MRKSNAKTLDNIPLFSEDELSRAANSLQGKKADDAGGIPAKVLKSMEHACP